MLILSCSKDIWKGALESLSPEERQQLKPFQDEKLEVLSELVRIAEQKRTEAQKKRWKFTHHGRTYIVRDYLEKIIVWVEKFKAVGDVAVQYDPAHAALPWACVRFFLQVAVDNVNTFGVIVQSLSQIVNIIAQSTILEALYLSRILKVTPLLERSLTRLYALILRYLSNALRYYSTGTAKNLVKGIFTESSQNISEVAAGEQNEIQRLATIAEAEMRDLSNSEQNLARTQQTIELKSILSDLKVPISRIQADMSQMMRLAEESERLAILKSLSTIPYPSHHQTAARGRLKESGEWLLRHPAFVSWRGSSSSTILWLHGIPGCGKTKLCSVVIDSMKPARTPAGSSECLAFFYCARDPREPLRGQCSAILQSLLRQIVSMAPARTIPKPVKTAYQQIQDEGFGEREWRRDECVDTIVQLMDIYPSITIIIDALDECDTDERMDLLIALKEVRDNSANLVKIFISSRDDVDIFTSLADASDIRISADDNEEDIGRFVQEKVDALMNNREKLYGSASDGLRREMMSVLSEKAQGM